MTTVSTTFNAPFNSSMLQEWLLHELHLAIFNNYSTGYHADNSHLRVDGSFLDDYTSDEVAELVQAGIIDMDNVDGVVSVWFTCKGWKFYATEIEPTF